MELWNRPLNRMLCAEALEGRWLLSAAAPSVAVDAAGDNSPVEIVELEPEEQDDSDSEIAASELPADVVESLNARFPGAQVLEAEMEDEDGVTEYSVTATLDGKTLDVTFSSSGAILETEEVLSAADLPQAVRDWLETNYPGAAIDEAAVITTADKPTYELSFAAPGEPALEATLALNAAPGTSTEPAAPPVSAPFSSIAVTDSSAEAETPVAAAPAEPGDPANAEASPDDAAARAERTAATSGSADRGDTAASFTTWILEAARTHAAEALASLAAGTGATVWRPELAGAITEMLPIDVASVEAEIQRILAEIDQLARQAFSDTTPGSAAMRFSIVVSLVAGAQLLLLDRKLRKGGPLRVFSAANSSWSWVLGTTMPARARRTNAFRR